MKLPLIEGYLNDYEYNSSSSDKRNLNRIKIPKNKSFNNLNNYFDTEKKLINIININKNDINKKLKRLPSIYNTKSINENIIKNKKIKIVKRINNNYIKNSNDTNNIYNDFTNNEFQTLINSKSTIIEDKKNDNNKMILPLGLKIPLIKYENKFNNSDIINNNIIKKENNIKYIFNGVKDQKEIKKIHEYNIKFNNSFLRNIKWNNNILKNILKNNRFKLNIKENNNTINNKSLNISLDKEKEKKNEINIFKNINNKYDNSYFNSEINKFYNKCKYKNNKLILSMIKKRKINKTKRIYLNRFNGYIYNNYCASNNIYNANKKDDNKIKNTSGNI